MRETTKWDQLENRTFNLTSSNQETEDKMVTYGGERRTKPYTNGDGMETQ